MNGNAGAMGSIEAFSEKGFQTIRTENPGCPQPNLWYNGHNLSVIPAAPMNDRIPPHAVVRRTDDGPCCASQADMPGRPGKPNRRAESSQQQTEVPL